MEVLGSLHRTLFVGGKELELSTDGITGRCRELVVKASYQGQQFKQYFRPEDFMLPSSESLLFLKLLLEEFQPSDNSIYFLRAEDIRLDNVTLKVEEAVKTLAKVSPETISGLAIRLQFKEFECLLQLPALIQRKSRFESLPSTWKEVSARQQTENELMGVL